MRKRMMFHDRIVFGEGSFSKEEEKAAKARRIYAGERGTPSPTASALNEMNRRFWNERRSGK